MVVGARIATAQPKTPSAKQVAELERRQPQRTESDADYARVKRQTAARLWRSLRTYARDLRVGGQDGELRAQTAFIRRHTKLLRAGYADGHREGLRDYWGSVSLKRPRFAPPEADTLHRRVAFYLPSVVKMASEIQRAWHETQRQQAAAKQTPVKQFAARDTVDLNALDALMASIDWRVQLQAEVSWVGLQDGYAAAGATDSAGVYDVIYWDLEPGALHCFDCVIVAGGSPYTIDTLNQTPGDGRTECGASCKCDLRAGVSPTAAAGGASLAARLPSDYPIAGAQATEPMPAPPDTPEGLSSPQKQSLDDLRTALASWDRVRGDLPALETLLAPESEAQAMRWSGVSVEDLTPAQRTALDAYVEALGGWITSFSPEELLRTTASADTQTQTIADATTVNDQTTRDFVRVLTGAEPPALADLNAGQRQALDQLQGIELLWDAVRGDLPPFSDYFDPASAQNLWQNPDLTGLTNAQQELVRRYFQAAGDWKAATQATTEGENG